MTSWIGVKRKAVGALCLQGSDLDGAIHQDMEYRKRRVTTEITQFEKLDFSAFECEVTGRHPAQRKGLERLIWGSVSACGWPLEP